MKLYTCLAYRRNIYTGNEGWICGGLRGVEPPLAKKVTTHMKYKMCAGGVEKCCPVRAKGAKMYGRI